MQHIVGEVVIRILGVISHRCKTPAGKCHTDGIVTVTEHLRDIVSAEIHSFAVIRQGRFQKLIGGDFDTINICAVLSETAHIKACLGDIFWQMEFFSKVSGCNTCFSDKYVIVKLMTNPFCLPIA